MAKNETECKKIATFVAMDNMHTAQPPRPIVNVAAENGAILGLYLIMLALMTGAGTTYGIATLAVWLASAYLPVFLYTQMRRHYAEARWQLSVAELWSQALMSFVLGALIQAVAVYILLRFISPSFIATQVQTAIDTFKALQTPEGDAWAATLERIRANNGTPTAADVTANLIVFNTLCGAVLGLVDSVILAMRYRSPQRRQQYDDSHSKNVQ